MKHLFIIALLAATVHAETIEVSPPISVRGAVSRVTLDGNAQYNTVTRDWVVVVSVEVVPAPTPAVDGVAMDQMPSITRRAEVTAKRAEIVALAGKDTLTEAELSAAVRGVVMQKLQAVLAGMGAK